MTLEQWLTQLCGELGLDDLTVDKEAIRTLLDVARDAAHQVERVAAPLTTFVLGVAVGRGASLAEVADRATARLTGSVDPGAS